VYIHVQLAIERYKLQRGNQNTTLRFFDEQKLAGEIGHSEKFVLGDSVSMDMIETQVDYKEDFLFN